jgi:hypothetical protein
MPESTLSPMGLWICRVLMILYKVMSLWLYLLDNVNTTQIVSLQYIIIYVLYYIVHTFYLPYVVEKLQHVPYVALSVTDTIYKRINYMLGNIQYIYSIVLYICGIEIYTDGWTEVYMKGFFENAEYKMNISHKISFIIFKWCLTISCTQVPLHECKFWSTCALYLQLYFYSTV